MPNLSMPPEPTLHLPHILLIAGTGRNCGKTTFACRIIERFSAEVPLFALKVSGHRSHLPSSPLSLPVLADNDQLWMMEETDRSSGKDSSRMLAAGAVRSFFAIAGPEGMKQLPDLLVGLSGADAFWVVESGALRQVVEPGVFVRIGTPEVPDLNSLVVMKDVGWKQIR